MAEIAVPNLIRVFVLLGMVVDLDKGVLDSFLFRMKASLIILQGRVAIKRRHLTTHSTGARVSLPFIVNLSVPAVRRARLIRAFGGSR